MRGGLVGRNLVKIRERRMWTQARLAGEAGVSPTTVSGIESGRIGRPHFGTLRKLARALGVEPEELVAVARVEPGPLSLEWAMAAGEEEFERGLEGASVEGLSSLSRDLGEEGGRLRRLYGQAGDEEQRRLIKVRIRRVAADSGSVDASIAAQKDKLPDRFQERRSPEAGRPDTPEHST